METRTAYVAAVRRARSLSRRSGLLRRLERSERWFLRHLRTLLAIYDAEDLAALDLAWWTYRAIAKVERFLEYRAGARVFEFGSGASTAWLARRANEVHSVEHDPEFSEVVRQLVGPGANVKLHVVPPSRPIGVPAVRSQRRGCEHLDFSDYVATIEQVGGEFDLVVIDGRARVESLRRALPYLAPAGLVVFDDICRQRYRSALCVPGFVIEVLRGAAPCLPYPTSTGLLHSEHSRRGHGADVGNRQG